MSLVLFQTSSNECLNPTNHGAPLNSTLSLLPWLSFSSHLPTSLYTSRTGRQALRQGKMSGCQAHIRVIQPAHDVPIERVEPWWIPNVFQLVQGEQHFLHLRQLHIQLLQETSKGNLQSELGRGTHSSRAQAFLRGRLWPELPILPGFSKPLPWVCLHHFSLGQKLVSHTMASGTGFAWKLEFLPWELWV